MGGKAPFNILGSGFGHLTEFGDHKHIFLDLTRTALSDADSRQGSGNELVSAFDCCSRYASRPSAHENFCERPEGLFGDLEDRFFFVPHTRCADPILKRKLSPARFGVRKDVVFDRGLDAETNVFVRESR